MAALQKFDDLIPTMKRAGLVATGLAAIITAKFGFALGEDMVSKFALAGLLALCTFIVGYALVAAYHAYARGMKAVATAAVALFSIAVCVEFLSHTGFTAANRDATVQQAKHQTEIGKDKRATIANIEERLGNQRSNRSKMQPQRSAATARSDISNAESHRFYKNTDGCKETKGPQTRAFCDSFRSAQADLAMWDDISRTDAAIAETEAQLEKARANSATTEIGHAAGASQGLILASMLTQTREPGQDATFWAGIGISALLALFAVAAGGLLNFIAFAFDGVDVASPAGSHIAMAQNQQSMTPIVLHETHVESDGVAAKLAAALRATSLNHAQRLGAA